MGFFTPAFYSDMVLTFGGHMRKIVALAVLAVLAGCANAQEAKEITADWRHSTNIDPMTDAKRCTVRGGKVHDAHTPMITYAQNQPGGYLSVVGETFPGESLTFRVDDNPAISAEKGLFGPAYTQIHGRIISGGKVLKYKVINWPDKVPKYYQISLDGIRPQIEACRDYLK